MDRVKITDALNLLPGTRIFFTNLELRAWGDILHFTGLAGVDVPFGLQFRDCREWRWQTYRHRSSGDDALPTTELVNFKLGRSQHRSPAHLLTEHFGVSLYYGDVTLIRDGQETVLG